ncbi:MAG: acyltransferase [Candidatus Methanoperedens sp.]|nr:acyltransferase [Candidatus Methanoperedens sp.]
MRKVGIHVRIGENLVFDGPENIIIGNNVRIGNNCRFFGRGGIHIGNNIFIADNVTLASATHDYSDKNAHIIMARRKSALIDIEDNVWIGVNVIIMPGITINEGAIIGANAVVTKDVAPYSVVAGVPAKFIKNRY